MRLTHLGHACLLVETAGARLLLDPGSFSAGFDDLTDLDAIVVTHQHPDHLDPARAPALLAANAGARLLVEPETTEAFDLGSDAAFPAGAEATVGGVTITAVGGRHARIHDGVPVIGNVGVLIREGSGPVLFHPGDSYAEAPPGVDVLALPLSAPWTKVSETLDFVRAVHPGRAVPIHDGVVSPSGRKVYLSHVANFGGTDILDLAGAPVYDL